MDFDRSRWDDIFETAERWWAGELERPLLHVTLSGADPRRPEPKLPAVRRTAEYGADASVEDIVDRWDYDFSGQRWLGDAFPARHPDFGPGCLAATLGAETVVDSETVWFRYEGDTSPADLRLDLDFGHPWVRRIEDIYRAALDRWDGNVQLGMTDLGGALDVLSTFRPGEKLLLDLYDAPEDVVCRTRDMHALWWRAFEHFNRILRPRNPGYTAWTPLFSADPFYMLQCDFCYMIGPEQFDAFVRPELAASCRKLAHPFYHLDGPGQLPHLDSLLRIPELEGIQWVPGAGHPDASHWIDVYRRIREAGKLAQVVGDMAAFDAVASGLGSAEGLFFIASLPVDREREARDFLARHGAPAIP